MDKKVNWIITDQNIVVNYDGQTHQLARTDACAPKLIQALKEKRFQDIPNLISAGKRLEHASGGMFSVKNGQVLVDGVIAPRVLGRKIEEFANEGLPYEPLVKFAQNLQKNPSFRAVNELYQFLEKNNHPITENGCFIAYKKVRNDFKDIHSGTFDNSVGQVVEMPRNMVNEDPNQTCSYGLHVANWHYARHQYGGETDTMLEVEVNPADVVAVPVDYNQAKMRTCKYKVLSVVEKELSTVLRVTDPTYDPYASSRYHAADDLDTGELVDEEEDNSCDNCGRYAETGSYLCEDEELDEEESSEEEELAVDESSSEEEDDEYPWEDELDDK